MKFYNFLYTRIIQGFNFNLAKEVDLKILREWMKIILEEDKKDISWVNKFEQSFKNKFESNYAIAVNSGTSGLHAALLAAGVGECDEVIQPSITVVMDAYVTIHTKAKPVFVDINRQNWNIDIDKLEAAITPKTKAIITVSLYGLPVQMEKIMTIARKHNLVVIDDSAETFLANMNGSLYTNLADITVYSFERTKHMTAGSEGGMVTTNNTNLAEKIRKFAGIGYKGLVADAGRTSLGSEIYQDPNYERFDTIGFNYRMNAATAAFGLSQLEILDELVNLRQKIGKRFLSAVKNCSWLIPQKIDTNITHTYFTFGVLYEGESKRDITWKEFYKMYKERCGDGFYACWKNPYLEPSLRNTNFGTQNWDIGLCPIAEEFQSKIMAFKTNYKDYEIAESKIIILENLIDDIGR